MEHRFRVRPREVGSGDAQGGVAVEPGTLDARCDPDLLTATGFTFRHPTLETGVAASLARMAG